MPFELFIKSEHNLYFPQIDATKHCKFLKKVGFHSLVVAMSVTDYPPMSPSCDIYFEAPKNKNKIPLSVHFFWFWYWCNYLHRPRHPVAPIRGIF